MAHDVFISHARKDKDIADAICKKLESAQVRCWMAPRDISAGEDRTEATRNAIGTSRAMILILSENANAAAHIEREIAHAFYTKRPIVPIRLANTLPRRDFLFYLGSVRWFNSFSPSAAQHLAALTAHIKSLVPDRNTALNDVPHRAAIRTMARSNPSNSWPSAIRVPHYWTLGILKWATIAACLFLLWFLCFAQQQTKEGLPMADNSAELTASGPGASPGSSPQGGEETSASKSTSTFTRFGLWEPANTGPTPLAKPAPEITPAANAPAPSPTQNGDQNSADEAQKEATQQDASNPTPLAQPAPQVTPAMTAPAPSPAPHDDQNAADEAQKLATQQDASNPTPLAQPALQVPAPAAAVTPSPTPRVDKNVWYKAKKLAAQLSAINESSPDSFPRKISRQKQEAASPGKSDSPAVPRGETLASDSHRKQDREPDSDITWRGWQQLPAYEVRIRTGDRYLGGEDWGHYLAFELAPESQKVVKVSSIHLQGDTAPDRVLSPDTPNTTVTIVNNHPVAEKGFWSWMLRAKPAGSEPGPLAQRGSEGGLPEDALPPAPAAPAAVLKPFLQPDVDEYHDLDRDVSWRNWQEVPSYEVRIRTGDRRLGDGNWAHYLAFELTPGSQKVIKVKRIHLEGMAVGDAELSPSIREAVIKIVNHDMTAEKGFWGWTLQEVTE
jgi:hypothetical protein